MPAVRGRDDEYVVAGNGPFGDTHRARLLVDAEAGGGIDADGQRVADGRVDADVSVGRVHRRYRPHSSDTRCTEMSPATNIICNFYHEYNCTACMSTANGPVPVSGSIRNVLSVSPSLMS